MRPHSHRQPAYHARSIYREWENRTRPRPLILGRWHRCMCMTLVAAFCGPLPQNFIQRHAGESRNLARERNRRRFFPSLDLGNVGFPYPDAGGEKSLRHAGVESPNLDRMMRDHNSHYARHIFAVKRILILTERTTMILISRSIGSSHEPICADVLWD